METNNLSKRLNVHKLCLNVRKSNFMACGDKNVIASVKFIYLSAINLELPNFQESKLMINVQNKNSNAC